MLISYYFIFWFWAEQNCLKRKKVAKDAGWRKIEEFGMAHCNYQNDLTLVSGKIIN